MKKSIATVIPEPETWYLKALAVIAVIGAVLRLYHLDFNPLWLDEASTVTYASATLSEIWDVMASGEFTPPLFYWMEHFMMFFGSGEFILRFVPAIAGILTVPAMYFAGKEFHDESIGIVAAAATAISPFLIFYSQEARAYSLVLLFIALASIYYFRALKVNNYKNWLLFASFSALAFCSHFYALVVIGAYIVYALYVMLPNIRNDATTLVPMGAGGVLFWLSTFPILVIMVQLFAKRTASAPTYGIQGFQIIFDTSKQIAGSTEALWILAVLMVVGVAQAFFIDRKKGVFLVLIPVFVFIFSIFMSYRMPMLPRYLIFLVIPCFFALAFVYKFLLSSVFSAVYSLSHKQSCCAIIVILLAMSAFSLPGYYSKYSKDDWRGIAQDVYKVTKDGDTVIVIPGYLSQPLNYYYSNQTDKTMQYLTTDGKDLYWMSVPRSSNNTVFYVITMDIAAANPQGTTLNWINTHTRKYEQKGAIYIMWSR